MACIYVATRESGDGYADQYWISTATGLLQAAERTERGELVYRFTAGELSQEPQGDDTFLLPDGGVWPPPAEEAAARRESGNPTGTEAGAAARGGTPPIAASCHMGKNLV